MRRALAATVLSLASIHAAVAQGRPVGHAPVDALHAWVGLTSSEDLEGWTNWQLAQERRLVTQLLAVKGPRTVANTLVPYDQAQFHLNLAGNEISIMFAVHPRKQIRDKAQALQGVISAETTKLSLNQAVYSALNALDTSAADAATKYYKDRVLLEYRLSGVDKDESTRAKVQKLQDAMTATTLTFNRNMQDDVRKVLVHNAAELDGLPEDYVARHAPGADGVITLTSDEPDMRPVMTYASSATLRREMFLAYNNRAYPVNKDVLLELLRERQELATTLGFARWADLAAADMMIGSVANVKSLLQSLDEASRPRSEKEFALIEAFAKQRDPSIDKLIESDARYWAEQYKRSKYAFDSQSVRPYFPYAVVEQGILATAARLFHLQFKEIKDASVWDPAVHTFDVIDGGRKTGRIYLDMHPRDGKDKWFSESSLIPGSPDKQVTEAVLVCNFPGGTAGDPGLMQLSDVVTFFHEFGHMMHEVLGGRQRWSGQSGITTERDFGEAPSQMLEEMFNDPAILQGFARHYQSGETLPLETIDRMNRASYFGRATWIQLGVRYSTYSLQLHDDDPARIDLDGLWQQDAQRFSRYQPLPGTHEFASFYHLTVYSSNYYIYMLDKVIAVDLFAQFDPKNLLDGPTALRYRREVLEPGGSKPARELVKNFIGREQNIENLKAWMDKEYQPATAH